LALGMKLIEDFELRWNNNYMALNGRSLTNL